MIMGIDYEDPRPELAIEFAQLSAWTYPAAGRPGEGARRPAADHRAPGQTFFVRADGTIAYRHLGPFASADQIRALARQHLGVSL